MASSAYLLDIEKLFKKTSFVYEFTWNSSDVKDDLNTIINTSSALIRQNLNREDINDLSNPLLKKDRANLIISSQDNIDNYICKLKGFNNKLNSIKYGYSTVVNFDNFKTVGILNNKFEVVNYIDPDNQLEKNIIYIFNKNFLVCIRILIN